MAVRSRFLNYFLKKKKFILKIGLAKFEVILANTSPNFISVLVQMRFFLTFQRCSSVLECTLNILKRVAYSFKNVLW